MQLDGRLGRSKRCPVEQTQTQIDGGGVQCVDGGIKIEHRFLAGNNALFLDFEMERGADGANTGYCFPDMLVDVVRLSKAGKRDEAHDLFDAHLPLIRYEQQPGPGLAVRKYIMKKRGIIASDTMRKPFSALTPAAREEVEYLLARLAKKDPRAAL